MAQALYPGRSSGNVVTSEMVDALHEGMTKNQVIFLLGTPALRNLFHKEQWNYVYYLKPRFGQTSIRKLEITLDEDGRVESSSPTRCLTKPTLIGNPR